MKKRELKSNFFGFKDKFARRRTIGFIVVLLILFVVLKFILFSNCTEKEPKKYSLLLDNELLKLKKEIILDDNGTVYISKDDVEEIFDKNIYYNQAEKELITTFNKHIAVLKIDNKNMMVNDSSVELKSPMIEKNKVVYIPISEMGIVYDLEFENTKKSKMIIADSVSKEKSKALALKKFSLKQKPKMISKKIAKIEQGEYVVVIEENGKYYKIRSARGTIGYVKKKKIADLEKIRDNWDDTKVEANILKNTSDISKKYMDAKLDSQKTNVAIPNFFYVDFVESTPVILDKTNIGTDEYSKYMNWIKENKIEVWATLINNSNVSNSLRTYTERNKVINDLYYTLVEHEFQGININFEKIDDVNSFNRFIIELTPRLKELGLKVAITANKNVDKEKLKDVVDIIIE